MRTVLTVLLSPQVQVTRRVYTSVRAGWWTVCNMGGRGTFRVAVSSAVISRSSVALALATGRVKAVSPSATKVAVAEWPPHATPTVPVMPVTSASSIAWTDWLKWPPYTGRSSSWRVSATHSEAMTPVICHGVHSREVTSRSHSSPSAEGSGYGIWWLFNDVAPLRPKASCQEKVKDGAGPSRVRL